MGVRALPDPHNRDSGATSYRSIELHMTCYRPLSSDTRGRVPATSRSADLARCGPSSRRWRSSRHRFSLATPGLRSAHAEPWGSSAPSRSPRADQGDVLDRRGPVSGRGDSSMFTSGSCCSRSANPPAKKHTESRHSSTRCSSPIARHDLGLQRDLRAASQRRTPAAALSHPPLHAALGVGVGEYRPRRAPRERRLQALGPAAGASGCALKGFDLKVPSRYQRDFLLAFEMASATQRAK